MNTKFSNILCCILSTTVAIAFFLPTTGWAGVFKDNFDDGDANGWIIEENASSEWKVMNGGYHGSIADGTESVALIGSSDWQVESIKVKIRDVQGEWLAVVWRYQDLNNFDAWWLNIANRSLEAWPKIGAYKSAARTSAAVPFNPKKEFTLKIVISGDDFDVFFDGQKVGAYTNNRFKAGKVGLLVWAGSATFDDVVIEGPNVSGGARVKPYRKKTTIWGMLKAQY